MKTAFRVNDLCLVLCLVFAPLCIAGEWDASPLLASSLFTSLLLSVAPLARSVNVSRLFGAGREFSLFARAGAALMLAAALNGVAALVVPSTVSDLRFAFGAGLSAVGVFLSESTSRLENEAAGEESAHKLTISAFLGFALEWSVASVETLLAENAAVLGACLLLLTLLALGLSRFIDRCTSGTAVAFAGGVLACYQTSLVVGSGQLVSLLWVLVATACSLCLVALFVLLPYGRAEVSSEDKPVSHEMPDDKIGRRLDELSLSPQERAAVELTLGGKTSSQAAVLLDVKPPTVRNYLQRAYRKAGVASIAELRVRLGEGACKGDLAREGSASARSGGGGWASFACLAILAMLPINAAGIPAADILGWVPVGCTLGVVLPLGKRIVHRIVGLVSSLSLSVVMAFNLMSSERGWTPMLLVLSGLAITSGVACGVAGLESRNEEGGAACYPMRVGVWRLIPAYLVTLMLTAAVPQIWCLFLLLGAFAAYGPRANKGIWMRADPSDEMSSGRERGVVVPDLVALYCGVILCDICNGYSLFYSHLLCIPLLLLVALAAMRGLPGNCSDLKKRQLVGLYVALGAVAVPLSVDVQRFIVAALFAVTATLAFEGKIIERGGLSRRGVLAFAAGAYCSTFIDRFNYVASSSPDLTVADLMNGATFRVTAFAVGSVLVGYLYWRECRSRELASNINLAVEPCAVQYFQARGLTPLESQIMFGVMCGRTTLEIAKELNCSVGTINAARHKTYGLLGVHSREQLVEAVGGHLGLSL